MGDDTNKISKQINHHTQDTESIIPESTMEGAHTHSHITSRPHRNKLHSHPTDNKSHTLHSNPTDNKSHTLAQLEGKSHISTASTLDNFTHTEELIQELYNMELWGITEQGKPPGKAHDTTLQKVSKQQELKYIKENEDIRLNRMVWEKGYPNRWGAKIPIKTSWDLEVLEELLQDYHDKEIIEWMRYGWPIGRLPTMPDPETTQRNHQGANLYPEALKKYIDKEQSYGAIMGPFTEIPFTSKVGISPLSTRPKKDSEERRILLDLSFPPGQSVNDGMIKDNYLGFTTKLSFPKTDQFAHRIFHLGTKARMFKVDLHRYFRQLNLDPGDYSLIGYIVDNKLYFDKVVPMGVRTGPYIAQRISSAITWIVEQLKHFLLNYVDDFVGADYEEKAWQAYNFLIHVLEKIRIQTSPEKIVEPTTRLEFLGTTFDSERMTMEVPEQKMNEILKELQAWENKKRAYRREVESLIGKLQFAARCVRPGRILITRLINWLKGLDRESQHPVPEQARKDIRWWKHFMKEYNGVSLMWLEAEPTLDTILATDACLTGYGGISGQHYFKGEFGDELRGKNIAILEIIAVMVGLKLWAHNFRGKYFWIHVDNEAVATILNTGASKNEDLQEVLREIAYLAAQYQFVIRAKHIPGVTNRIPDWLSRWGEEQSRIEFNKITKNREMREDKVSKDMLTITNPW